MEKENGAAAIMTFLCSQEAENIIQKIKQQQYSELLSFDQLFMERKDQKVFLQFGKVIKCIHPDPSIGHSSSSSSSFSVAIEKYSWKEVIVVGQCIQSF